VCVSLFYVNDISSTGSRLGFPVYTLRLNSDAGYAVLPLAFWCPCEHRRGLGVTSYGRGLDSTALAPLPALRTYEWFRARISIGPAGCRINRDYARRGLATKTSHPSWGPWDPGQNLHADTAYKRPAPMYPFVEVLRVKSGFESPDLDRPSRQLHQQGLSEARLGYRDGSPGTRCQ